MSGNLLAEFTETTVSAYTHKLTHIYVFMLTGVRRQTVIRLIVEEVEISSTN